MTARGGQVNTLLQKCSAARVALERVPIVAEDQPKQRVHWQEQRPEDQILCNVPALMGGKDQQVFGRHKKDAAAERRGPPSAFASVPAPEHRPRKHRPFPGTIVPAHWPRLAQDPHWEE